jgi:acetyl-CoA carboxylase carboxyl transferase subunit alpha
MVFLEFEQPLESLYDQLDQIRQIEAQGDVDVSAAIRDLEGKIAQLRKEIYGNLTGWQKVQLSRHPERPYTLFYIQHLFKNFIELHGDRLVHDDKAIVGGLAQLEGETIMIIGHQKGTNTKSRQYRNFGMANPRHRVR